MDGLSPQLDDEQWQTVIDTNLTATFRATRAALPKMMRARFGRVINVASVAGLRANPGQANYSASKAGVIGFTKTVAAEVARRGVTVNAVAPGLIETDLHRGGARGRHGEGDPGPPGRHPGGGRGLHPLPRLRASFLRDRNDADRRRRPQRLDRWNRIRKRRTKLATQVSTENVEKTIYDGLVELGTERDDLSREATLESLDVDSLDLVELAQIVEDEYGVELKGDDVKDVKTVGEVIDLVVAKAG